MVAKIYELLTLIHIFQTSTDGQDHFIGCSLFDSTHNTSKTSHRMTRIPGHVRIDLLQQLFSTGSVLNGEGGAFTGPCHFSVPPRCGLKQKKCRKSLLSCQ